MGKVSTLDLWWQAVFPIEPEECSRCYQLLPVGAPAWMAPAKMGMQLVICEGCMISLGAWWQGLNAALGRGPGARI